jgi:hypothetical protein
LINVCIRPSIPGNVRYPLGERREHEDQEEQQRLGSDERKKGKSHRLEPFFRDPRRGE